MDKYITLFDGETINGTATSEKAITLERSYYGTTSGNFSLQYHATGTSINLNIKVYCSVLPDGDKSKAVLKKTINVTTSDWGLETIDIPVSNSVIIEVEGVTGNGSDTTITAYWGER